MNPVSLLQNLIGKRLDGMTGLVALHNDGSEGSYMMLDTDSVVVDIHEGPDLRFSVTPAVAGLAIDADANLIMPEGDIISTHAVSLTWMIFGATFDGSVITRVQVYYWPDEKIEIQAVALFLKNGSELIIRKDPFQSVQVSLHTDFKGWIDWYARVPAGPLSVATFDSTAPAA